MSNGFCFRNNFSTDSVEIDYKKIKDIDINAIFSHYLKGQILDYETGNSEFS